MVMRYHLGLAVGHAYAHEKGDTNSMDTHTEERDVEEPEIHPEVEAPDGLDFQTVDGQDDSAEHTLRNRDDDAWDNSDESGGDDEPNQLRISDVEEDTSEDEFVFLTSRVPVIDPDAPSDCSTPKDTREHLPVAGINGL